MPSLASTTTTTRAPSPRCRIPVALHHAARHPVLIGARSACCVRIGPQAYPDRSSSSATSTTPRSSASTRSRTWCCPRVNQSRSFSLSLPTLLSCAPNVSHNPLALMSFFGGGFWRMPGRFDLTFFLVFSLFPVFPFAIEWYGRGRGRWRGRGRGRGRGPGSCAVGGPGMGGRSTGRQVIPALGLAWSDMVNSRLFLQRHDRGAMAGGVNTQVQ